MWCFCLILFGFRRIVRWFEWRIISDVYFRLDFDVSCGWMWSIILRVILSVVGGLYIVVIWSGFYLKFLMGFCCDCLLVIFIS